MKQYLKEYQVKIHTLGPVFVGSGKEIGKKEYLFLNRDKVGIVDIYKVYQEFKKRKISNEFERYMLGNARDDLTNWIRNQKNLALKDVEPYVRYILDCDDAVLERGSKIQIMECIKDAYGQPYIPGTSLKGMLRTILLGDDILCNPQKYDVQKREIYRVSQDKKTLKINASKLETAAFRTLERNKIKPDNAVNDWLQGIVVSDSMPLTEKNLVLCQKLEVHTNGTEKRLPQLLECIKPGTEIAFTITIDTTICNLDDKLILQAVDNFMDCYYKNFAKAFSGIMAPQSHTVFLGGGCGFVSKTEVYPLYEKKAGIEVTQGIFEKRRIPRQHKHEKDHIYGASPHILKCTKYKGQRMQIGLCKMEMSLKN